MRTVIVEDEAIAAQSLRNLILEVDSQIEVVTVLETIEESVEWLSVNDMPDLLFMDIHLADGSSFAIFEQVDITCPVVFTTAYDEYALKAFEVNSIDYLLKPINKGDLSRALNKYKSLKGVADRQQPFSSVLAQLGEMKRKYKTCFLIPERDKLIPLPVNNIAYVFIDTKMVKVVTLDNRTYYLSQTLDEIMGQLDPSMFFRANRQFIVSRNAIKDISIWFGSKLSLNMNVEVSEKIIVSKARVAEFKVWFSE